MPSTVNSPALRRFLVRCRDWMSFIRAFESIFVLLWEVRSRESGGSSYRWGVVSGVLGTALSDGGSGSRYSFGMIIDWVFIVSEFIISIFEWHVLRVVQRYANY